MQTDALCRGLCDWLGQVLPPGVPPSDVPFVICGDLNSTPLVSADRSTCSPSLRARITSGDTRHRDQKTHCSVLAVLSVVLPVPLPCALT
jgi:hypothetical protein